MATTPANGATCIGPKTCIITPDDTIYLIEGGRRVTMMTLDGEIIDRWGERGDRQGQFKARRTPAGSIRRATSTSAR